MSAAAVLALDVGTSSVRAILFGLPGGRPLARFDAPTPVDGPSGTDAEALWRRVEAVLDRAHAYAAQADLDVAACGVSMFWHSLMLADASLRPLDRLRLWSDDAPALAGAAQRLRARVDAEAARRAVGAPIHPSFPSVKAFAALEARTAAARRRVRIGGFEDLLALRLFGRWERSLSMASATGLWDSAGRCWHGPLLDALGVRPAQMPPVDQSGGETRMLAGEACRRWPRLAATPWRLARGDGALSNLGLGATGAMAGLTIGTSTGLRLCDAGFPGRTFPRALFHYALDPGRPVVGGALSAGGNLLAWAAALAGRRLAALEDAAALLEPGAAGLLVLPGLWGERSPDWPDDAMGGILGLRAATPGAALVRAAMDAIAAGLWAIAEGLEAAFGPQAILRVRAGGKAVARSAALAQIAADALGRPLDIVAGADESSAFGAARIALAQAGVAPARPRRVLRTYMPRAGHRDAYGELAHRQAEMRRTARSLS